MKDGSPFLIFVLQELFNNLKKTQFGQGLLFAFLFQIFEIFAKL
jgi:hypothetical protein